MSTRKKLLKQGIWFFFFNSIIILAIALRYFNYISGGNNLLTIVYLINTTLSHFITLSCLLFLGYFIFVLLYPSKNFAWILAVMLSTVGSFILVLDTFVYDLYRMHINRFVLELLFGGNAGQIFKFHFVQYLKVFSAVLLYLVTLLYLSKLFFSWDRIFQYKKGWVIILLLALMMFSSHFMHAWAEANNYVSITKNSRCFPLYFPTSDRELMFKLGLANENISNKKVFKINDADGEVLNYPRSSMHCQSSENTNIILILIDSWYYKSLTPEIMPNIYEFSKKCEIYNKHYSGSNGTRTGVFSLFYSIPGTYWDITLASFTSPVFIDILLQHNYQIEAFTSASLVNPPFNRTVFRKINNLKLETKGNSSYERDVQLTKNWLSYIEGITPCEDTMPIFSFLFYDALHSFSHPKDFTASFQPSWGYPKYELLNNDMDPAPFLNLYKNSALFVDSLVGCVLHELESKNMLENSWIIITGDHGQEFNDNGKNYWGHNGNYSAAQMQVPLLIYKPNSIHKSYKHWTSHYDIVPTIMDEIFYCKNDVSDYSIGKLLSDTTKRGWLIVGSSDNFAILEPDRINSVYFSGTFDITDSQLNFIDNSELNFTLINQALLVSKTFYK